MKLSTEMRHEKLLKMREFREDSSQLESWFA